MSFYPNDKPFERVEDLISSLFLRDGCDPGTLSWACQTRQHHVVEEMIRIQLARPYIPADLNVASDAHTGRVLGFGRGYSHVDSTYLFPMRALSSGDPLIMDLCYILRANPHLNSIAHFDELLDRSPVRQAYRSLLLADIGLPIKSINQYCTLTWLKMILDDPQEDLSRWFIPMSRDLQAYSTAMSFQPGQIEMLCDALFTNLCDAAIQQREFEVMIKFMERVILRLSPNVPIQRHMLQDPQPLPFSPHPNDPTNSITRHPSDPHAQSVGVSSVAAPEAENKDQDKNNLSQNGQNGQPIPLVEAFIKLLKLHVAEIADDQWTSNDDDELLFLAQIHDKVVEAKRAQLRAQLKGVSSPSSSPNSLQSSSLNTSLIQSSSTNKLQPNALTNVACMYKALAEMHFFSAFYLYTTKENHYDNIMTTLVPLFPQYLWPTSDRCIIKLLSMCLPDEQTSNYIGDVDEKLFEIPQKKGQTLDPEDPEVKFGLMIEDEEYLFQKAIDVETRRGFWKLAILYACNLNDHDLIVDLITLAKVTKLDYFMPESIVAVNGTMLAQICNLPHSNAATLHKLLSLYTVKITTNSQTLGIRSNVLFKIATKEHIVVINQHPLLQQLLDITDPKITNYSMFESGSKGKNGERSPWLESLSSSQQLHSSLGSSQTNGLSSSQSNSSSGPKPKLNHQLLHQEHVLQCLYSLLAYVTKLKIYRPAIVYTDLVVLLQVHTAQGIFMPQLYDFLITTVMSDVAIATLFKRNNIISIVNSIYSTPKPITHQCKVMTDDYYRYANETGTLDQQYNLEEFLIVTGHRKRVKKGLDEPDLSSSSANLSSSSASVAQGDDKDGAKKGSGKKQAEGEDSKKAKKPSEGDEMKAVLKNSFKTISGDIFNTSLPLFNIYFNLVFTRFATVQLFLNSKTLLFDSMSGITTSPSGDITSPLDNAVLYHDVPTVEYLLSLGFVPLSSTMYHLHQHFVFDHRNATNSGLFTVNGIQPITLGQANTIAKYKQIYHHSGQQSKNKSTLSPSAFASPHKFFTPTASYHFDLVKYQDFVSAPIEFNAFRQKIFLHIKASKLQNGQSLNASTSNLSQSTLDLIATSSSNAPPPTKLTPREIYNYYATSSPATELMKLLLQSSCPVFQLKLLGNDHQKLYQQALSKLVEMETERRERVEAGDKTAESAKEQLSMYALLEEQYPGFDSTLITSRLETLYSVDFHAVQFHQLYHQQQMIEAPVQKKDDADGGAYPRSRRDEAFSHIPKITQEDIIALLFSAQHNGNPLLIYHIVQTTQLYMAIYTASFLTPTPTAQGNKLHTISSPLPPYPTIHDNLPPYSYDTLSRDDNIALQQGLSIEEIAKNASYRKLAASLNAIMPLLSESNRPLQLTRAWAVFCGRYMHNLQRLPSSLLLVLTFIPVTIPAQTFDLVQSFLYGHGDPTSHNPTTGRNVMSLLLSLCGCASDTPTLIMTSNSTPDDNSNLNPDLEDDSKSQLPTLTQSSATILGQSQSQTNNTHLSQNTQTPKKKPSRYIFNSESYALKQNAYEFATGVLGVICGMNNTSKYTPEISPKTQIPGPFELFHSKPITTNLPPSTTKFTPSHLPQPLPSPSLSVLWPNPYKFYYFYSPAVFSDLLGSTLAMFVISRKTIEDFFCLKLLKFLVQNGEDITCTNLLGQNALMLAVAYQRSDEVIQFLLQPHPVVRHVNNNPIPAEDIIYSTSQAVSAKTPISTELAVGQDNYFNGVIPGLEREMKFIDVNQVDIFGRNLYHYRLNPGLQYDKTLFTGNESGSPKASDKHKCDVLSVGEKRQQLLTKLSQHDDFTLYFPDFDPNQGSTTVSQHQGMRWYDLCDSLMKAMSGVYDGEELETRSREFNYIFETFSSASLTEMITAARSGEFGQYGFKLKAI